MRSQGQRHRVWLFAVFLVAAVVFSANETGATTIDYETEEGWVCTLENGGSGTIHYPEMTGCGVPYWLNARNCAWLTGLDGSVVYWEDENWSDPGMAFTSCHNGGPALATFECNKYGDSCDYTPLD